MNVGSRGLDPAGTNGKRTKSISLPHALLFAWALFYSWHASTSMLIYDSQQLGPVDREGNLALIREQMGSDHIDKSYFFSPYHQSKADFGTCKIFNVDNSLANQSAPTSETSRFSVSSVPHWKCRQEIRKPTEMNGISDAGLLLFVDFQIFECPPSYSSSTFQVEGNVVGKSLAMGKVSGRDYATKRGKEGCAVYNATVPIVADDDSYNPQVINARIDVFWTSEYARYSNQKQDIKNAYTIKGKGLPESKILDLITEERLDFLEKKYVPLAVPTFDIQVILQQERNLSISPTPAMPPARYPWEARDYHSVPSCGSIPLWHWTPTGVVFNKSHEGSSPSLMWPFQAARCSFPSWSFDTLNTMFAGLRIRLLADSHGHFTMKSVISTMCPNLPSNVSYFAHKFDCPLQNNTFGWTHRFFRGVFKNNLEQDHDFISRYLRSGSPNTCKSVLGLGLYNVTILSIPTWLFVYETQEGLDEFISSIRNLAQMCKKLHPELMENHIFLVQSPPATEFRAHGKSKNIANAWRGIHNYRMDQFVTKMKEMLHEYIDGIIPVFDLTLARMKYDRLNDGLHLRLEVYKEIWQVQITAIQSAFKHKQGINLPAMSTSTQAEIQKARWFANQPLEYKLL